MKRSLVCIAALLCALVASRSGAQTAIDPALVGTWKLHGTQSLFLLSVRADGGYRVHGLFPYDEYRGLTLCQGAGNAASSLGLLVDGGGNDLYRCRTRSWGWATPEKRKPELTPCGIFLDLGGTDRYQGREPPKRDKEGRWTQGTRGFGWEHR